MPRSESVVAHLGRPLVLRGLASLAILAAVTIYLDPEAIWAAWGRASARGLAPGIALGVAGLAVQWIKWHRLVSCVTPSANARTSLLSLLAGFSLGLASPGRLGELGRGLFMGQDRTPATAAAVADRLTSCAVTLLAGMAAVAVLYGSLALRLGAWALGVVGVLVAAWSWRGRWYPRVADSAAGRHLSAGAIALGRVPLSRWLETMAWSTVFNLLFFCQFYVFVAAWGPVPARVVLSIPAIFAVKAVLPIGIMDLGVREGAAVFLFTMLGHDPAVGFDAALLMFGTNLLVPGVIGLFAMNADGRCASTPARLTRTPA
ncbi:lysylphosphatidylglycerol synthase transmembrane domain-containing protein [Candidatus Latescibacterota bacterium]